MTLLSELAEVLERPVLTGSDMAFWSRDWTNSYNWAPLCVVRPGCTTEVSAVLKIANAHGVPVVPVSGNTGLVGGTFGEGAIMLSLDRMNQITEIRPEARIAIVEAGVVLSNLHDAAAAHDLKFPMTFGARGSCMVGGILSTNAGGSNVLRYGNMRDLVLGLEVVLADGRVIDLMSELHKDNSGLNLRHLLIGAEGALGVITRAVLKLVPAPRAYATAMLAVPHLDDALGLLNRLQELSGGAVEAFEFMNAAHVETYQRLHPEKRWPFDARHDVNILVELAAVSPRDATADGEGRVPLVTLLEDALEEMLANGTLLDAVVAQSDGQRSEMWERREAAAEVATSRLPVITNDIAVGLDKVAVFLERMDQRLPQVDPAAEVQIVAHLGDGNVHYTVWPGGKEPAHIDRIMEAVEEEVRALDGSFSAEHGIGLSKKKSMARHKDPVAIAVMRDIKAALDPNGILNPGKVLPDSDLIK